MKYFETESNLVKSWCNEPEIEAIEQAKTVANLPFLFKHMALMPDAHMGMSVPIGSVFATKDIIIPIAVMKG